jgi:hypothetical protein
MLTKFIDDAVTRRHPAKTREEIQAEVEKRHEDIGRGIARRFTRGNVNIKRGAFLTDRDLEARRKK